jgi:RHS repeat-associated protein
MDNRGALGSIADSGAGPVGTPDPQPLPEISLPTGGGAIRGIDEKLTVGLATGAANLTIPIVTSGARGGLGPALALAYDSGAGNGPFGLGWRLGTATVTRKTSRGLPTYRDDEGSDVFVLSEAEDLVPALVLQAGRWVPDSGPDATGDYTVTRYRPRVESGFARIERWQAVADGDTHWRTIAADDVTRCYGVDPSARIADPADPGRVFSWLLELAYDDRGNAVSYAYKAEDTAGVPDVCYEARRVVTANRYLKYIRYGNVSPVRAIADAAGTDWRFEVVFDYGEHDPDAPTPAEATTWPYRSDAFSAYRSGFEVRTQRLCRRILMFHHFPDELGVTDLLVHATELGYATDAPGDPSVPAVALLTTATHTGYLRDPQTGAYAGTSLPPLELAYSPVAVHDTVTDADPDALANLPTGSGGRWRWVDLDGEGTGGVLADDDQAWYYKRNTSAYSPDGSPPRLRLGPLETVAVKPTGLRAGTALQLLDLLGDGRLCAVDFTPPLAGYFAREDDGRWSPFAPFTATAAVDWSSPNLRAIDLDGDGRADVLLTDDDAFTWYPWDGADGPGDGTGIGFGAPARVTVPRDEQTGPALVLADGDASIYLADMSGDGLTDLVRIRNGEVCYWPNLGYGRFGAKVTMAAAPWFEAPDLFNSKRVHLADIDGSGTSDLVYVSGSGVRLWFNQSGNGYTTPTVLSAFPQVDDTDTVEVTDLLGAGTSCLSWSRQLPAAAGRQLRYVDLMGGVKPHLLTTITNNTGAETTLTYATSTSFYLRDRLAGRPWATRLAFPVHVVAQQEIVDRISGTRLASSYLYHHGFFDGFEREFRGFGLVEQIDRESVPAASGTGTFTTPLAGADIDLPPVRTRTWFHTGAYVGGADIAAVLAGEYYAGDPAAVALPGTRFEQAVTAEEMREACRALRGRQLRSEVYADDGTPQAAIPYAVVDHRYRVGLLQPPYGRDWGVTHASELETRTFSYERGATDPRVAHTLNLEIDPYGTITKSAAVTYRRRDPGTVTEQAVTSIVYSERDVANITDVTDRWRLGVPVETRTYELTGLGSPDDGTPYDPETLRTQAVAATVIAAEVVPDPAVVQKRLLSRSRIGYRGDDLATVLPTGQAEPMALVDRAYTLAMTPGLAASVYPASIPNATDIAMAEGGYVDLDGDGCWWAPTARVFYSPDPDAPDAAYARAHFFLPQGHVDPFGARTTVAWTGDLLVASVTDALGNTTGAQLNYRVLGPWLITDPNGNRTGVRYDALGMVVATAVMGKATPAGDEGDHLDTGTPEASPGDDPTSTVAYDLGAYRTWALDPAHDPDRPAPVWAHTRQRVRHQDPATPWIESYTYTDGLGRAVLTKSTAEAGDAPVIAADGTVTFAPAASRWVGTGKIVHDSKANPVKAYEPFFDTTPGFVSEAVLKAWGVTAITRYDPVGRVIRVDAPDGTFTTVEFGPWQQLTSDANDTVLASDWYAARTGGALGPDQQDAAVKAAAFSGTPLVSDLDPAGRVFHTIGDGPGGQFHARMVLDIQGRVTASIDALGRTAMTTVYAVGGATVHTNSIDAGERWFLHDIGGLPLRVRDGRGQIVRNTYDVGRRPLDSYVTPVGGGEFLAESTLYGEGQVDDVANNLRGAVYRQRDSAGQAITVRRDFHGNTVSASRELLTHPEQDVNWSSAQPLTGEVFTTGSTYDALNRIVTSTAPDGTVTTMTFNERSLLTTVTVALRGGAPAAYVDGVVYDVKGRRTSIVHGNGAATAYTYDPATYRLVRLVTTRPSGGGPVQDLTYTYDPVGNITRVADAAQPTVFFASQLVAPVADYTYDAVYRLTTASGREHVGQAADTATDWDDSARRAIPLPADIQAMRNYTENFGYDLVGNITTLAHVAAGGGWTRTYTYDGGAAATNRLTSTTVGAVTRTYGHDGNGNMDSMPQLSAVTWDFRNQLSSTAQQVVVDGTPQTTYYRYDAAGVRIRKATVHPDGSIASERVYLGAYEVYREYGVGPAPTLERTTNTVSDGVKHVAVVETVTIGDGAGVPAIRYQFANQLGSACVELDENAAVITYEEYFPYGATSFQAGRSAAETGLKRYRFTGTERDAETGLNHHGARYYATWLGRWTSTDPAGMVDGAGLYTYARSNPIGLSDINGKQSGPVSNAATPYATFAEYAASVTGPYSEEYLRSQWDASHPAPYTPVAPPAAPPPPTPAATPASPAATPAAPAATFTVTTRSFAPFETFGGGYHGDNRGFSASDHVTSRVTQSTTFTMSGQQVSNEAHCDPTAGYGLFPLVISPLAWPSNTYSIDEQQGSEILNAGSVVRGVAIARSTANVTPIPGGVSIDQSYAANNPVVTPSPDIDVQNHVEITAGPGSAGSTVLTVSGTLTGDGFPNAEVVLTDHTSQSVLVHTFETAQGPMYGPIVHLWDRGTDPMGTYRVSVNVDSTGRITGVGGTPATPATPGAPAVPATPPASVAQHNESAAGHFTPTHTVGVVDEFLMWMDRGVRNIYGAP